MGFQDFLKFVNGAVHLILIGRLFQIVGAAISPQLVLARIGDNSAC